MPFGEQILIIDQLISFQLGTDCAACSETLVQVCVCARPHFLTGNERQLDQFDSVTNSVCGLTLICAFLL